MTTYAFCEPAHQTGTRWHIRALSGGGPRINGGIPDGTTALCGADIARGWDIDAPVRSAVVRALLSRNNEAPHGSLQVIHPACADAYLAAFGVIGGEAVTMEHRKFGPKTADHPSVGNPCPACKEPFAAGDYTTLVTIGPGNDPESRERARAGRVYTAVAVEAHWACVTGEQP